MTIFLFCFSYYFKFLFYILVSYTNSHAAPIPDPPPHYSQTPPVSLPSGSVLPLPPFPFLLCNPQSPLSTACILHVYSHPLKLGHPTMGHNDEELSSLHLPDDHQSGVGPCEPLPCPWLLVNWLNLVQICAGNHSCCALVPSCLEDSFT